VKPNGLTVIDFDSIQNFLSKTKIEKIWGIGRKTSEVMKSKGIKTAQDFVGNDIEWVRRNFSKPYEMIWMELHGIRILDVDPEIKDTYGSIQKTRSFHPPTNDKTFLLSEFSKNIEDACKKARHYKLIPRKISIFLKTQQFKYITCSIPLVTPTNAPEALLALVHEQFHNMHEERVLYRTTGITLHDLVEAEVLQGDLFGSTERANKFEKIHDAIDILEDKFGKRLVYLASTHGAIKHRSKGTDSEDLDRNLLFL
jgi:nucleotidyltransferase/DNA polymerase involved in DNA repair